MSEFLDGNDEILEKKEVPAFLNGKINKRTVDYFVATGQIPFFRIGQRKVLFSKNRLKQWMKERENIEVKYNKN